MNRSLVQRRTFRDPNGREYLIIPMSSSGICGYSALSYVLTGNENDVGNIIEDLCFAFERNPALFVSQTDFGQLNANVHQYRNNLLNAVADIGSVVFPELLWLNEGHFLACCLMFDIALYVFHEPSGKWIVYNQHATRGFACLLHNGSHFDVLQSLDRNSRTPTPVHPQALVPWIPVPVDLTHYAFVGLSPFPDAIADVASNVVDDQQMSDNYCPDLGSKSPPRPTETNPVAFTGYSIPKQCTKAEKSPVVKRRGIICPHEGCKWGPVYKESALNMHVRNCHAAGKTASSAKGVPSNLAQCPSDSFSSSANVRQPVSDKQDSLLEETVISVNQDDAEMGDTANICTTEQTPTSHDVSADPGDVDVPVSIDEATDDVTCSPSTCLVYKCNICDDLFSNSHGLSIHRSRLHGLNRSSPVGAKVLIDSHSESDLTERLTVDAVDVNKCETCNIQFATKYRLKRHNASQIHKQNLMDAISSKTAKKADSSASPSIKDGIQPFCNICSRVFMNERGLKMHNSKKHKSKADVSTSSAPNLSQSIFQNETSRRITRSGAKLLNSVGDIPNVTRSLNIESHKLKNLTDFYDKFPPPVNNFEQTDLHAKLKAYHDHLLSVVDNVSTEKLSNEVSDVVADPKLIGQEKRPFTWSKQDEKRLNSLNVEAKTLPLPDNWFWSAKKGTEQEAFNSNRMQFCVETELEHKIVHCPQCKSTGLLVGLNQIYSDVCFDCLHFKRKQNNKGQIKLTKVKEKLEKYNKAWSKVRPPTNIFPKRSGPGPEADLPIPTPAEAALLALVHPVVSVTRNFISNAKFKQESICLLQNQVDTWSRVLPRANLNSRFVVVEHRVTNHPTRYLIANVENVRHWLIYLFQHHTEYIRLRENKLLELSEPALEALENSTELAEVLYDADNCNDEELSEESGILQAEMSSGLSKSEVFTFDHYPYLYLKSQQLLKIRQGGLIEIIEESNFFRRQTYNASANICFPHLYPHGQMSPTDFGDHKLGRYLLKKLCLFAHKMSDGSYKWNFSDSIHMMHTYARLQEMSVHANVGWYLNQHPDNAYTPLESVLNAFKEGANDQGLIDSKLPNLTGSIAQIRNSREYWFSERLSIEAISRDLGDPNLFLTINCDPRAWPDVRELIYELEHGENSEMDPNWFEKDTEKFTELLDKYAIQISIYLYRKCKIFMRAFLCGICRVEPGELKKSGKKLKDWSREDRYNNSWYWGRVEFTETRGVQHWHCLAKLPNVLDTALLGRIIHNGRVLRQELKCGNIRQDRVEEAWTMIEMGLLASRYCTLFAESISQASFYTEHMDVDSHLPDKVIDLDKIRGEFIKNYVDGKISVDTHPIMRAFNSTSCDKNQYIENAKVAAVSCMHHCIAGVCGGDEKSGVGCRFSFPKKKLPHTVPAIFKVNSDQMEVHILPKRTADRVPHLNPYFLKYWRANHDITVLVDASHKMRYATKYVSKSKKHTELLDDVITSLGKRSRDLLPPNLKQALSNLILADCSHRAFLSKPELAYKVADLPDIQKSFSAVSVVGHYPRASITQDLEDKTTIVYSDRTEYSAYAERCNGNNICKNFERCKLQTICFREFAETIAHTWKLTEKLEGVPLSNRRKFKNRDIDSGFWEFHKRSVPRRHIRWSTVIYSDRPELYEPLEQGLTTSQTLYYDLPAQKRKQLQRAYQELVCYVPWQTSPENTFLSAKMQNMLKTKSVDPEADNRYSLMKMECFHKVYMQLFADGKVAPLSSQWHRDNQFSYTMFLTTLHNDDVRNDRAVNKGVFKAQYENAEELTNTEVEIRPALCDELDEADVPSILNFLPPDTFREVLQQGPPKFSEICIAFPLQHAWQRREEMTGKSRNELFLADPPAPAISLDRLSFWHKKAIELMVNDRKQQILYVYGKAGTGKTEIALHICQHFKGRVQSGAGSGKAASNFNGPTVHAMFGWAHNEHRHVRETPYYQSKLERLRIFYQDIELFVIDEVNAMSAEDLGLLDEVMCAIFDPDSILKSNGKQKPFGGKKMLFLGDAAQLRPVGGAAIYDKGVGDAGVDASRGRRRHHFASATLRRTARGQTVYSEHLSRNCVWLERGFRNRGLLQEILDRVRNGEQTRDDLEKLMLQRSKFPEVQTDYGIHYSNEACCYHNWRDVWETCKKHEQRLFVSRARYHTTGDNDLVVSTLAAIPAKEFQFAPDVLCLFEGCEVRLIANLNVSAGLVNSASGKVVKVLYDNADVQALLDGKHPSAYCVIVNFPCFRGFLRGDTRVFPFQNTRWVPVYTQRFLPDKIPAAVRKQQPPSTCYREQFPLDLYRNITTHRAQGQTWRDVLVSVDLGLSSPSGPPPSDVSSLIYVACTRVNDLKNLFVAPIFPTIWDSIGKSPSDLTRRESEAALRKDVEQFAILKGAYQDFLDEQGFKPDYSSNGKEWQALRNNLAAPDTPLSRENVELHDDLTDALEDDVSPAWLKPCQSERHIGIDQGLRNFAIVAVDKRQNELPTVVGAYLYDLRQGGLEETFDVMQLLLFLQTKTALMGWMQQPGYDPTLAPIDRVIVHIEQISKLNRYNKVFEKELGTRLQQLTNVRRCVVKLSSPHLHRKTGPLFKLGPEIAESCNLHPSQSLPSSRKRKLPSPLPTKNLPGKKKRSSRRILDSDVEPDTTPENSSEGSDHEDSDVGSDVDYKERKRMSSEVFKYIMHADAEQQLNLQLNVRPDVQRYWLDKEQAGTAKKFDDLGDALLHALNEILCGTTNYRPLIPSMPSLHVNRSIVVAILPDKAFWVSLQCTWNVFTIENIGFYSTRLSTRHKLFSAETVHIINRYMDPCLRRALTTLTASEGFAAVEHIRIIVKQLGAQSQQRLTNKDAGALTNAAVQAMKRLCDDAAVDSVLSVRNDKEHGWRYVRTMKNGHKIQVSRSTGKHTNAIVACLEWAKRHVPDFVTNRPLHMNRTEKLIFFHALQSLASEQIESHQLEMLRLSPAVVERLCSDDFDHLDTQAFLADLILIGLSKNNEYISAIAPNYRS